MVNHSVLLDLLSRVGPVKLHLSGAQFRETEDSRTGVGEGWVSCGLYPWRHSSKKSSRSSEAEILEMCCEKM